MCILLLIIGSIEKDMHQKRGRIFHIVRWLFEKLVKRHFHALHLLPAHVLCITNDLHGRCLQ